MNSVYYYVHLFLSFYYPINHKKMQKKINLIVIPLSLLKKHKNISHRYILVQNCWYNTTVEFSAYRIFF